MPNLCQFGCFKLLTVIVWANMKFLSYQSKLNIDQGKFKNIIVMLKSKTSMLRAPSRTYVPTKIQNPTKDTQIGRANKLQNNIMIKPSSGTRMQIDYKYETDEQIETEEECRKFDNKINSQKRNNSFSRLIGDGDDVVVAQTANMQQKSRKMKKSNKLDFYCCDSLAIRPSCSFNTGGKEVELSQFEIGKSRTVSQKSNQELISNERGNELSNGLGQSQKVLATKQREHEQKGAVEYRSLRPSGYKHRKIFAQRQKIQKKLSSLGLPKALVPSQYFTKIKTEAEDQFHITIETDQITNCCF